MYFHRKKTTLKFQQINLYVKIIEVQQMYLLNMVKLLSTLFSNTVGSLFDKLICMSRVFDGSTMNEQCFLLVIHTDRNLLHWINETFSLKKCH